MLVKPGWLAIYGKEADEVEGGRRREQGQNLVPVKPGEMVRTWRWTQGPEDPPARALLGSHAAGRHGKRGKQIDDEELRSAMQEKGLGTPGHRRAAIIEGPADRKYMLREGREIIPRPRPSSS